MSETNDNQKMDGYQKLSALAIVALCLLIALGICAGIRSSHDNNIKARVQWEACVKDHSPAECKAALS